jgi:ankyrin repeat protein
LLISETALYRAAKYYNYDVAILPLTRGTDVNAKDKNGWTALHVAVKNYHMGMAELLRQHGGHE